MTSGRSLRVAGAAMALSAAFVAACSLITDLSGLGPVDRDASAADALSDGPPAGGFTLTLTPAHVTADPGDAPTPVTVTLIRGAGFTERVSFQITGGVTGASATTPPDIDVNATTSAFTVAVQSGAVVDPLEHVFVVRGTSAGGTQTFAANLSLRVGSLLAAGDGGVLVMPDFAYAIDVKAWGAGGSGGGNSGFAELGGNGGAGGFASARFAVTPKSTLYVVTGSGGPLGMSKSNAGGNGGGFSGLRDATNAYWLIAGGGGGGGAERAQVLMGGAGGAGGGAAGASGGGCGPGGGATQIAGGVGGSCNGLGGAGATGTSLLGGDTITPDGTGGGVPGGGRGSVDGGGGGGGGGFFGGGAGSWGTTNNSTGGGGGGSGLVLDGGADATLTTGTAAVPPATTDPDYAAGVGTGGLGGHSNVLPTAGGNGRVVVRLAKP